MEEKVDDKPVASSQKSLSSNHDPGWNDPPSWAFIPTRSSVGATTPTKRLLNKRVAFPLNSTKASPSSNSDRPNLSDASVNLPPPPTMRAIGSTSAPHAPLGAPSNCSGGESSGTGIVDREKALVETLENLRTFVQERIESDGRAEEVERKIEALRVAWAEDKLDIGICEKVLELSKALRSNDVKEADKIHVSLIMNHSAVCNTWISGIRHMILDLREKSSQESCTAGSRMEHQDFHPYFLPKPDAETDEKL